MTTLVANLPTLTIPKFEDSLKDWVKFRDSYQTMVHNRTELCNIKKFYDLGSSLTGDATKVTQASGLRQTTNLLGKF